MTLDGTWTKVEGAIGSPASMTDLCQQLMYALKESRKSAGAIIKGSSDGATAGIDDVDRLSAANKFLWNTAGNAHSWFIDKHPTKSIYRTWACDLANPYQISWFDSNAIPTGGSATANPTQAGNNRSFSTKQLVYSTSHVAHKYWGAYTAEGDWWFGITRDGTGRMATTFGQVSLLDPAPGDNYNVVSWGNFVDSALGANIYSLFTSTTTCTLFNPDGTLATTTYLNFDSTVMNSFSTAGDARRAGKWPMLRAHVFDNSPSRRGYLRDIRLGPSNASVAQFKLEPTAGPPYEMQHMGSIWMPVPGGMIVTA